MYDRCISVLRSTGSVRSPSVAGRGAGPRSAVISSGVSSSGPWIGGWSLIDCPYSDVEEAHVAGVALDEPAPRLDVLAHEDREDLVRRRRVRQGDLEERAGVGIHRRLPQLVVVHLAEALVALDRVVLGQPPAAFLAGGDHA